MRYITTFLFWALATFVFAQPAVISGVINRYTIASAYEPCGSVLLVTDTAGFAPGTLVLIHHTTGAQINTTNTAQFGTVTDLLQTGRYEKARISGRTVNSLLLEQQLLYPILPDEAVQVVTIPQYFSAVVNDTLRPLPWNGSVGGILALEVTGALTLNAPVIADGLGFKGGSSYIAPDNNCTWILGESGYVFGLGNWRGGTKGEGITPGNAGQELGRGPRANGGGGGNDHNSGGGGGANTTNGGQGGNNNEPSAFGCDGFFPGLGGKGITNASQRLFMGGGGGAGHTNNTLTSAGGNGGGLIFISAGAIDGSNPKISANGLNGSNSVGDGGGGAGAGGGIWLNTSFLASNVIVRANGGNGGTASGQNGNRCFGPGGGGGGGQIITNASTGTVLVQGGSAGTVIASTNSCNGTNNGATPGSDGTKPAFSALPTGNLPANPPAIITQPLSQTACPGDQITLTLVTNPAAPAGLYWQQLGSIDWENIPGATGNQTTITVPANGNLLQYRCVMNGGNCFFFTSETATIAVIPAPTASFSGVNAGNGTFNFTANAQGNTGGPLWDFGDGTSSMEANPTHNFAENGTYTVSLTIWNACDTVTVTNPFVVALPPVAQFEVADSTAACNAVTLIFPNTSTDATSFAWLFPGGTPNAATVAQPEITYAATGAYTATLLATNAAGTDTLTQSFWVEVLQFPTASFSATNLPDDTGVSFAFTGNNALFLTWNFGDGSPVSNETNPTHTFPAGDGTYTVRLVVQNECGVSVLEQMVEVDDEVNAVQGPEWRQSVVVYPNPTSDMLHIATQYTVERVTITDAQGRILREMTPQDSYSVSDMAAGAYFLRIYTNKGVVVRSFLVGR